MRNFIKKSGFNAITWALGDANDFVKLPVLRGPAKGLRLSLNLVKNAESAYLLGKYDQGILNTMASRLLRPGMTAWDCGIYLGYYTCFMARQVGPHGKVVAFEPDPSCLARARGNAALNGFTNITWIDGAISDVTGEANLVLSGNTNSHLEGAWLATHAGGTAQEYADKIERNVGSRGVRAYTLDDALSISDVAPPDLVKLDIEGMEGKAIWQAGELIAKHAPTFVVELHTPDCDGLVWDFFESQNYDVFYATTMQPITSRQRCGGTIVCSSRGKGQ
jgi:FkbM family methyltransferase